MFFLYTEVDEVHFFYLVCSKVFGEGREFCGKGSVFWSWRRKEKRDCEGIWMLTLHFPNFNNFFNFVVARRNEEDPRDFAVSCLFCLFVVGLCVILFVRLVFLLLNPSNGGGFIGPSGRGKKNAASARSTEAARRSMFFLKENFFLFFGKRMVPQRYYC